VVYALILSQRFRADSRVLCHQTDYQPLNVVFYDIFYDTFYDIAVAEKGDADLARRYLKQRLALAGILAGVGYPFNPAPPRLIC
jgi:hypothetical protein